MVDRSAEDGTAGDGRTGDRPDETARRTRDSVGVLTSTVLRIVLAFVGVVLLLYAIGQAIGEDLLEMAADALGTTVGQWILIAAFALVLILVALRGFETTAR